VIESSVKFTQKIKMDARTAAIVDGEMGNLALMFEAEAKTRTPVLTGRLKSEMIGKKTGFLQAELRNNVEYAPYVEFGTSKMAPRAMMRQAAQAMLTKGLDYLKSKLTQA
jgi:HK97 gp10 family phage protein